VKRILTAMFLSLIGPGLGQIYNKEYKKGFIILLSSTILFLIPFFWIVKKVLPHLPDPSKVAITQEMLQSAIMDSMKGNSQYLNLISLLFFGIWAYSISQSYFRAKELNQLENPHEHDDEEDQQDS
jgi:hypothetical protein